MTKRRQPLTFADALTRIVGHLTYSEAARILGRSERMIYIWTDPDNDVSPSLDQALALEAAYRASGGVGQPILDAYAFQLDIQVVDQTACHRALTNDIATLARECGDAIATGIGITQTGASASAVHHALVEAEQARSAIGTFIGRLKSFLPRGAGPLGENCGGAST